MNRLAVLNVVGLTESLIGAHTPKIAEFQVRGVRARIVPAFPAVTCTAQSNYLTGKPPSTHGIVGNGWYDRDLAEVQFWKQSNHLVRAPKVWEELRALDPKFTCAKLFWWYNMYSSADFSITPRPMYPADGRKVFDIYTRPYSIRTEIQRDLGAFPFPCFWGPGAGVDSPKGAADAVSRWIAESAKWIEQRHQPTLSLVYLPHLDYNLQRHGPYARSAAASGPTDSPASPADLDPKTPVREAEPGLNPAIHRDLAEIDAIVGDLISFFRSRSVRVLLLSEYGITNVARPIHLNRLFREQGWVTVKDELGRELLDCGASRAFAVADHQVAHIHVNDPSIENRVRDLVAGTPGVARVLGSDGKREMVIDHARAGDLIAIASEDAWFTYYHWLDDRRAPDFARTVDIHRKPGYDPVELFIDPALCCAKARIAWKLLKKRLGFRMLMDVVPLDATLVRGSHGCRPVSFRDWPILIAEPAFAAIPEQIDSTEVRGILRRVLG